ncbi:Abi family protein [Salinarimonas rosea]|uniref:Abi family protein n=1 Tax=Salinarimonas rosea TaxID=552063 RepID=UPI0005BAE937|nr:Abi family protein [Salinarimonas rosea]
MLYTKPYLAVDDQLQKLKARGLAVSDDGRATAYLQRIGYYRLSGYWYPLRTSRRAGEEGAQGSAVGDDFKPGAEFGQVVDLYVFDKKLRLAMLDAIERVEVGVRTSIVLHMGRRDPWSHRDPGLLDGLFARRVDRRTGLVPHQAWLRKLDEVAARSDEQFAKHFRAKYPGELMPIWIAAELWDFGMLTRFYAGMRHPDKAEVAAAYGLNDPLVMVSWLQAINYLRNLCAHHGRVWNRALVRQPRFPKRGAVRMLDHLADDCHRQTRLYGTAAAIRFLLRTLNPSTRWPERLAAVLQTLPCSPYLDVRQSGFFPGWEEHDLWCMWDDAVA